METNTQTQQPKTDIFDITSKIDNNKIKIYCNGHLHITIPTKQVYLYSRRNLKEKFKFPSICEPKEGEDKYEYVINIHTIGDTLSLTLSYGTPERWMKVLAELDKHL